MGTPVVNPDSCIQWLNLAPSLPSTVHQIFADILHRVRLRYSRIGSNKKTVPTTAFSSFMTSAFADVLTPDGSGPDYERIRATVDAMVPFNNHLGIHITSLGPDAAVAETPPGSTMSNHLGTVHAGALFSVAEVAAAGAFCGAVAPRLSQVELFVLRDSRIVFLHPAVEGARARAMVDERTVRAVLDDGLSGRFDLDGKALIYDTSGRLVAKAHFDYVCCMAS